MIVIAVEMTIFLRRLWRLSCQRCCRLYSTTSNKGCRMTRNKTRSITQRGRRNEFIIHKQFYVTIYAYANNDDERGMKPIQANEMIEWIQIKVNPIIAVVSNDFITVWRSSFAKFWKVENRFRRTSRLKMSRARACIHFTCFAPLEENKCDVAFE